MSIYTFTNYKNTFVYVNCGDFSIVPVCRTKKLIEIIRWNTGFMRKIGLNTFEILTKKSISYLIHLNHRSIAFENILR